MICLAQQNKNSLFDLYNLQTYFYAIKFIIYLSANLVKFAQNTHLNKQKHFTRIKIPTF